MIEQQPDESVTKTRTSKKTEPTLPTKVRQLFVGNLPFRVRWQDLKDHFRTAGHVLRADLAMGPEHRSKGYGTVLFATVKEAQIAIDMLHNTKWHGRILKVRADHSYVEQQLPFQKKPVLGKSSMTGPMDQHSDYTSRQEPCRQLFVGNLPFHSQWQDIKDLFRGAGKIIRADVAQAPSGKSRGFGTVLFATFEDAEKAIQMFDQFEYYGRQLRVHYDKHACALPRRNELLLQQPISIFENVEFTPTVLESLNQTYGNTDFSIGKSTFIPNPSDVVYSPSLNVNHDYVESLSPGPSQQHVDHYSQHRSTFMLTAPYFEYYPSVPSDIKGTYDYQRILHQQTIDTQAISPFMHQNQSMIYPPIQEEKYQVPYTQTTTTLSPSTNQQSTFYEPYPLYLQRPHLEWKHNNSEPDNLLDGMESMGLLDNGSAGLSNLELNDRY